MPKKKKFIDKKKSVTFQLVHRSQQDPLVVDEDAPQRILQPIVKKSKETPEEREKRIEEQHKYGIYYDDDTNYLEFLKERSDNRLEWPTNIDEYIEERRRFALPKEVFASAKKEEIGMLNRKNLVSETNIELDPEVIAALENPDDEMEELEDNFIELADGVASDEDMDIYSEQDENNRSEEEYSCENSEDECSEDNMSTTSSGSSLLSDKRTNHSSCTLPFKDFQQEVLTKQMDKMLKKYDDLENLNNDDEEVHGCTIEETAQILKLGEEFFKSLETHKIDRDEEVMAVTKRLAKRKDAFKTEYVQFEPEEKLKYDCQSIISTHSRTRHLPTLIELPAKPKKIKVNEKTGMPMNILGQNKLTKSLLNKHNEKHADVVEGSTQSVHSTTSRLTALSIRDKNETIEEKKIRKKALKEYRQERRAEKKCNKQAFAEAQRNSARGRSNIGTFTME